ncbi:MAG: hypothetical protein WD048_08405 [Chitinophagales bacterium]
MEEVAIAQQSLKNYYLNWMFENFKIFKEGLKLITYFSLVILIGCNGNESNNTQKQIKTEKDSLEIENPVAETEDASMAEKSQVKETNTKRRPEYVYVRAKFGLNYRDAPKGEKLGSFSLGDRLEIVEYTGVNDFVIESEDTLSGEWLGVRNENDTVYVLSAFVTYSNEFLQYYQRPRIYIAGGYSDNDGKPISGFLNLSQFVYLSRMVKDYEGIDIPEFPNQHVGKNPIKLGENYRKKLLSLLEVSETDTVYIYNIKLDSIFTYKIKDLELIAPVNIYSIGDNDLSEHDYEIGFLLSNYDVDGMNFAYLGNKNIFQTGTRKAIIWEEIELSDFPFELDSNELSGNSYSFLYDGFELYLLNSRRHLVIVDSKSQKIIKELFFTSSEGVSLVPINTKSNKENYQAQWIGRIFKDKPPAFFRFQNYSFGCPVIQFVSEKEPSIGILCDNRH